MWLIFLLPTFVVLAGADEMNYYLITSEGLVNLTLNENVDKMDPNVTTHFIVHGWDEDINKVYYMALANEIHKKGSCNVVLVDYAKVASYTYPIAYAKSGTVEKLFANFIIGLIDYYQFRLDLIHLIGHSMGAQICGNAAKKLSKKFGRKIAWITGLDPARPLYEFLPHGKLTSADAVFVDIVHTDAGAYGYLHAHGDVDFFVNHKGQRLQPGCLKTKPFGLAAWFTIISSARPDDNLCSHHRSVYYYIDSVSTVTLATRCKSYNLFADGRCNKNHEIIFGLYVPKNASGKFFFNTKATSPYLIPAKDD